MKTLPHPFPEGGKEENKTKKARKAKTDRQRGDKLLYFTSGNQARESIGRGAQLQDRKIANNNERVKEEIGNIVKGVNDHELNIYALPREKV